MKRSSVKISSYLANKNLLKQDSSSIENPSSMLPFIVSANIESGNSKRFKPMNTQLSSTEPLRCDVCWLAITDERIVKFHKKKGDKDVYSCTICFRQFCFSYQLAKHMVEHKKDTKCDLSEVMFGYLMKEHKLQRPYYTEVDIRCNICWLTFQDQQTLNLHQTSGGDFSCSLCFRKFCFSHQLTKHTTEVHFEQHTHSQANTYSSLSYLKKNHFRCDICWFAFKDQQTFDIHKKMIGKSTHPCSICNRPFCLKCQLEDHMAEVHGLGGKQKYLCELCKIIFASLELLKQHNISYHNKQRYVKAQKYDSNEHLKKEHLRCEVCWLTFDDQISLDLHKKMSKEKCSCNICYRPFCFISQLSNHKAELHGLVVQLKNETNQCSVCKISFASEDLLKQHIASSHNPHKYVKAHKYNSNDHMSKEHLRCDICWTTFDDIQSLDIHKKQKNKTDIQSCNICYRTFCLSTQLTEHKVGVHGAL